MSTRQDGLNWLRAKGREPSGHVCVSKYYQAEESRWHSPGWWFEFPSSAVSDNERSVDLLAQNSSDGGFIHFRVPNAFLSQRKSHLGFRDEDDRVSLFLSAEAPDLFLELRGDGRIAFGGFQLE